MQRSIDIDDFNERLAGVEYQWVAAVLDPMERGSCGVETVGLVVQQSAVEIREQQGGGILHGRSLRGHDVVGEVGISNQNTA